MINWIIKIFAFVTVVALALGLAAEFTALAGNVSSLSSKPTSTSERPLSILTRRATSKKASKKPLVCEAYKWGSDFPQRPGGIFHGASYHVLTSIGFTAMMGHQVLRGLSPGSLNIIFKFFPGLQGPWGLSGSGAIMIYVSMQIMSYSIGTIHVTAAILLFFAGCLNLCGGFVEPIASCDGGDPYSGAGAFPPGGGYDDGYPDQMGGAGAPLDNSGDAPPDPYDGSDPSAPGPAMDTGDGVGASAPPPGMIDKEVKTFGGRPPGTTPAMGYGQNNAETNPAMLAATSGGQAAAGNPGEVVFDPSSGMWTTVPGAQPQVQQPAPAVLPGAMPGVPMGYDMLGRPIMAPGAMAMGMPAAVPGMYPGWPGVMPPQPAVISDEASAKSGKKQAKRDARKEFKKLRREEREAEREEEEQEERRREKEARKRQKEYERQVRREEKRQQNLARAVAMDDAQQRTAVEIAEEDARRRQYQDAMSDRRNQAMADAQKEAYEYQREDDQRALQARQEQEQYMMAREMAEQDAMQREAADEAEYKRQMQAQALSAAQRAAVMGDPLRPPMSGRASSRAGSARHRQRSPSPAYQEPQSDAYSQQGPMPGYGQYARSQQSAPQAEPYSQRSMPQMQQYAPSQRSPPQAGQYSHRSAPRASQYTQSDMPIPEQYSQRGVPPPLAYPGQRSIAPSTIGGASRYPGQQEPPAHGYPRQPPPSLQEDDQSYPYDDDDDAMTEIRSVRTETSSQRDLLKRRMMEERERVLAQQEAQKQQYLRPYDPYSAEDGFSDILADYRSGRSGRSGGSSSRRRQAW